MKSNPREYRSSDIAVTYDAALCIHAAECVRGLRDVFDTEKRPWIQPANASADEIAAVVHRCPTGALTYRRLDGGPEETPDPERIIQPQKDGPLYVRGELTLRDDEGGELARVCRAALCRCGASANKPFCDNSHIAAGFTAP